MDYDIEIKRIKELDFLNLFDIKFYDWNYKEGKKRYIKVNYYELFKQSFYTYIELKKMIKKTYLNLENYFKYVNKRDYIYMGYWYESEQKKDNRYKLEKYFLKQKLENKLVVKNTKQKTIKI